MSAAIFQLPPPVGSWFATIEILRLPDGDYHGRLVDMPASAVEALPGEVHEKMVAMGDVFRRAADSMDRQAEQLRPEIAR